MQYFGYVGKVLSVDLTTGHVRVDSLPVNMARDFIGGVGFISRLAYDLLKPGTDPLSPDNVCILGAGLLVGTTVPGSSKWAGLTKEPLGNVVAPPSGGMMFGYQLKRAGYDCVVITGKADIPVYLKIIDDNVEICDASELWGKDIFVTTDNLSALYRGSGIVAIGQAGENLVRFALAMVDKMSNFGRGGFGAVMGSKNLKALVAHGTGKIQVAHPEKLQALIGGVRDRFQRWDQREASAHYGSMVNWHNYVRQGQAFYKGDWTEFFAPEDLTEKYGPKMFDRVIKKKTGCPSCPIPCRDVLEIKDGEFKGHVTYAGAYLNSIIAGIRLGIDDYRLTLKLADQLDRYGLCYLTFSTILPFLFRLREMGIITEEDVGGLPLKSNFESIMTWAHKISLRESFGNIVGDGWKAIIDNIGRGCEKYAHISKGKDFQWEPRTSGLGTMEFEQIVSPRGPWAGPGGSATYIPNIPPEKLRRYNERIGVPADANDRIFSGPIQPNAGRLTRYGEDSWVVLTSLGICQRPFINRLYHISLLAEIYSAVTGEEVTSAELMVRGERGWNVLKALNVREGFGRKDDEIPDGWFEPMKAPNGISLLMTDYYKTKHLTREDLKMMLDDYYEERGWNIKRGIPTREKLESLGLKEIAIDLEKNGFM